MGAMLRYYYYPALANRDNPTMWQESGCQDAWQAARHHYAQLKAMPRESYLSREADEAIRRRHQIHLSEDLIYKL